MILAKVILNRLNTYLPDDILLESQCVFRKNRGAVDMIVAASQIQENVKSKIWIYMFSSLTSQRLSTQCLVLDYGKSFLASEYLLKWSTLSDAFTRV